MIKIKKAMTVNVKVYIALKTVRERNKAKTWYKCSKVLE